MLSKKKFDELTDLVGYDCIICKDTVEHDEELTIDYNQENKEIRGLLCERCGNLLKLFGDSPKLFWNLIGYLDKYHLSKK